MAKKLKYPYEQWKQEKLERTPSPPETEMEEQPMELTCYKQEVNVAGKWCSMLRMLVYCTLLNLMPHSENCTDRAVIFC